MLIGAHVREDDPVATAAARGADIVQMFLADPQGWKKPPTHPQAEELRAGPLTVVVHSPYVLNLASLNNRIRIPSRKLVVQHAAAAAEVGAMGLVVHGGHASGNAKAASNWVMGDVLRKLKETKIADDAIPLTSDALAGLIRLLDAGQITGPIAKDVFEKMFATGRSAAEIIAAEGLGRIADTGQIDAQVRAVLDVNRAAVAEYRAGKTKTFGFLVGQVMKAMAGRADPALVNDALRRALLDTGGAASD